MPHLSPMSWLNMTVILWSFIMILNTQTWWIPSMKLVPLQKNNKTSSSNKWNW
uniref:ATP synthase F0 subunit 8 n=1 Tax=Codonobdella sp. IK-2021 TaxID=2848640 RepID=A0A8F2E649_9ANNE|nr:ATP synthase F0 subunit 8 [Codonobdella sp. B45A]QWT29629.1 ATP synthase F0 subunit 8 [Codonobdella sp. IK-2021]UTS56338.1 ATP synthase F0 subunit 8 [Codonobdella sp. B45A]